MTWKPPVFEREEIIFLIGIILILISTIMVFIPYTTISTIEYPARITVKANATDVAKTTDILDFGTAAPGLRVKKYLIIEKKKAQPAIVYIDVKGDIEKYIELEDDNFIINTERQDISITAKIPKDAEEKSYNGIVTVSFKMSLARKLMNVFN